MASDVILTFDRTAAFQSISFNKQWPAIKSEPFPFFSKATKPWKEKEE